MASREFDRYIKLFRPVMTAMCDLFGDSIEFILHDLSTPQSSVVEIVGNVTGRQIGAPCTNLVMEVLKREGDDANDILSYPSIAKDGRQMRSSTIFIRNDAGHIVGCMCYNIDLTEYRIAERLLRNLCATAETSDKKEPNKGEIFAQDISEVVGEIIEYEFNNFGKPVPMMSRADKLKLISLLESKGIFDVKGAPEMVSQYMGSSVFTIYNYLKEIRNGIKDA